MAVFRFAPSPNGFLHLGHAFSALLNDALARAQGGRLLLRIEDIDVTRCRPEFEAAIYEDLAWLGLTWEKPVRRQSAHFPDYQAARDRLAEHLYPCFCSRSDIAARVAREGTSGTQWPRDPDGAPLYPGTCRELTRPEAARRVAAGETPAWRLDVAKAMRLVIGALAYRRFDPAGGDDRVAAYPARWGDVIIARKEVPTSYHLSVVVDDALQGVTHVVRGRDLEAATDIHALLQALLRLPSPAYHHHRLIADDAGLKLAKSAGSTSLRDLRVAGISSEDVRRGLGF
jgi:glutamyl-Q tRNA(Asp) synthetase